ncbi:MAG: TetR/AcrR family transcriptional regulator [Deltaproteobacteria bacterium]|nr:TetR/AcrR family transcriptional regulator [Deltaproteobacteria bacterium]
MANSSLRTADRILDAAEELFAAKGFEGSSMSEIADRVEIRAPSLYKHYESKEKIYEFIAAGFSARSGREQLEQTMQHLANHPNLPRLIQMQALTGGEQLEKLLVTLYRPLFRKATRLMPSGSDAGGWSPAQLRLLIMGINNMLIGYFTMAPIHREVLGKDPLSKSAIREQTDFLVAVTRKLWMQ